jgi:N-acetylneuraminic acid mutarotase
MRPSSSGGKPAGPAGRVGALRAAARPAVFPEPLEPRRLMCDWGWEQAVALHATPAATADASFVGPLANYNEFTHGRALHVDAAAGVATAAIVPMAAGTTTLRIDAGGSTAYMDTTGRVWSADSGFSGGSVSLGSFPVANTADDKLYYTRRWGNFVYARAVTNGSYVLKLHFMDPFYAEAGFRKFDVFAENGQILNDFDIAANGGYRAAVIKSFPVSVSDGVLNLSFRGVVENALLAAIELVPATTSPPPSTSAPAAPLGLTATAAPASVALRWTDASGNESGFRVERKDGASGSWRQIATVGANATGYVDSSTLSSATTYAYRVRAYNSVGNSRYSNESSAYVSFGTITWKAGASSPITRAEAARAVVNNRMYVFGGYYNAKIQATPRCDVYDPATNTWKRIADMPVAITHQGMVVDGTTVWLVGGYVGDHPGPGTTQVWKYDTLKNTWSRGPSLPVERGAGAAAILDRKIYFFGGMEQTRTVDMGTAWVLDLANQGAGWRRLPDMPNPRNHLTGIAYGGKVYAIGGHYQQEHAAVTQREVDRYDPATNTWTRVADTPTLRSQTPGATFVYGNRIIVVGGADRTEHSTTVISAYDPARNRWQDIGNLPAARRATCAGVINGRLVVTTGNDPYPSSTTWISNVLGALE